MSDKVKDVCKIGYCDLDNPEINAQGDCCCNCTERLRIQKCEWVNGVHVTCRKFVTYVCKVYTHDDLRIASKLSGEGHSMCEMHTRITVEMKKREEEYFKDKDTWIVTS